MPKRQFDTYKFEDPWYRTLPPRAKLLWEYMLCACNCAGIWKADFHLASFCIGVKVESELLEEHFDGRCVVLKNGSVFIPKFIIFQYAGMDLGNTKNGVVRGIHRALESNGLNYPDCLKLDTLSDTLSEGVSNPTVIGDKDKDKDKESFNIKEYNIYIIGEFDKLWRQYPNKQGRIDAIRHFKKSVRGNEDVQIPLITKALNNYLAHVADKDPRYIKNGSTWFHQWEDWVENPITNPAEERADAKRTEEIERKLKSMGLK